MSALNDLKGATAEALLTAIRDAATEVSRRDSGALESLARAYTNVCSARVRQVNTNGSRQETHQNTNFGW